MECALLYIGSLWLYEIIELGKEASLSRYFFRQHMCRKILSNNSDLQSHLSFKVLNMRTGKLESSILDNWEHSVYFYIFLFLQRSAWVLY